MVPIIGPVRPARPAAQTQPCHLFCGQNRRKQIQLLARWSIFLDRAKVEGPKQSFGCGGGSSRGPMDDFCRHFGAPAARQGAKRGQVRVKSSPSLAKECIKRSALPKMACLAQIQIFITFSGGWGGPWRTLVGSRAPLKDPREANKPFVPGCEDKGSIGVYAKGCKWMRTDGNEAKPEADQRSKFM